MSDGNLRFRWWYLLILLPLAVFLGVRWYIGHRIEQAIAGANTEGNTLRVAEYSFGFFPLHLAANNINFEQERKTFAARGTLNALEVSGLNLLSLLDSGPIELNRLALRGLDASLTRHTLIPKDSSESSPLQLVVDQVFLDSTFVVIDDEINQRGVRLANFSLDLQALHLPFLPTKIRHLQVGADSTRYRDDQNKLLLSTGAIGYGSDRESITITRLHLTRDTSMDLRASEVRFSGLNAEDLEDEVYFDSIKVASLGGVARVPGNSANAADSTAAPTASVGVGMLSLPDIDLSVSGSFGTVTFGGEISSTSIRYRDSLALESLQVNGREINYSSTGGLRLALRDAVLRQGELHYPLRPGSTGLTRLEVPEAELTTDEQTVTATALRYTSETGRFTAEQLRASGKRLNGTVERVAVEDIDRDAVLAGGPATAASALLSEARLEFRQPDGDRYRLEVPEVRVTGIAYEEGLRIERAQVENAGVRRRGANGEEDLVATGIYLDQYAITSPVQLATLGPSKVRVADLRIIGGETPVDYHFYRLAYASRAGLLTLDSLNRINQYSPDEMFSQEIGKSWMNFSFDGLRASGIDHSELVAGNSILIDSLYAQDFRLMVVEDISLELPAQEKVMPIEGLRKLGMRIKLNDARFSSTDIAYGVVDSILEPKTIHFGGGDVVLTGLDTEVSTTDSVRAVYDAVFEKTTPLHAEFILARDSSGRNYAVSGELGTYDLSRVNPLMEVAADATIETGVIDRLTYRGAFQDEVMTGEMELLYHDLDLKVVGSGAWIKNLLSGVVVKNDNLSGEDFRQGKIYHEHDRTKSFFNAYWKGLVSGMRSSALSDIALQKELD